MVNKTNKLVLNKHEESLVKYYQNKIKQKFKNTNLSGLKKLPIILLLILKSGLHNNLILRDILKSIKSTDIKNNSVKDIINNISRAFSLIQYNLDPVEGTIRYLEVINYIIFKLPELVKDIKKINKFGTTKLEIAHVLAYIIKENVFINPVKRNINLNNLIYYYYNMSRKE